MKATDSELPGPGPGSRLGGRLAIAAGLGYAVLVIAVAGVRAHGDDPSSDFVCFHRTARHFLEAGEVTTEFGVRSYLPFFTVLMIPFALLPASVATGVFVAGSLMLYGAAGWLLTRGLLPDHPTGLFHKLVVPMLILAPYITACAVLGQVTLLVTGLVILGWALFFDERPLAAGVPLGLAILIKPFLLVALGFFAVTRQWKALAATAAVVLAFGAGLPGAVLTGRQWVDLHREYVQRAVIEGSGFAKIAADVSRYDRYNNQSLAVVVKRLTRRVNAGHYKHPFYVNVMDLPAAAVKGVYAALLVALLAVTAWHCRRPLDKTNPDRWHYQFNLWVILGLLASPVVWTHYFPLLLYPIALLTVRLMIDGDAKQANRFGLFVWSLWVVAALSFAAEWIFPGRPRAVGVHIWATVLLLIALIRCANRFPSLAVPPPATRK